MLTQNLGAVGGRHTAALFCAAPATHSPVSPGCLRRERLHWGAFMTAAVFCLYLCVYTRAYACTHTDAQAHGRRPPWPGDSCLSSPSLPCMEADLRTLIRDEEAKARGACVKVENGGSEGPLDARQARVWGAGAGPGLGPSRVRPHGPTLKAGPGKTRLSCTDGETEAQRGQRLVRDTQRTGGRLGPS